MNKKDIKKLAKETNNKIIYEDENTIEMETDGYNTITFEFNNNKISNIIA